MISMKKMNIRRSAFFVALAAFCTGHPGTSIAQNNVDSSNAEPVYRQAGAPIESRVRDLLGRMTMQEKVRQLDLYSGALTLFDKHFDETHATTDASFLPAKAEALWGSLGVGAIHDIYPTATQSNEIQKWAIAHNRLRIPVLFIEEALTGSIPELSFPRRPIWQPRGTAKWQNEPVRPLLQRLAQLA